MRLTLRTLLAYMDDILDPADHEDLAKKIEASDFAGELIHRSRDVVRRLRLAAPDVFSGEDDDVLNPDPASDANAVAEYLDNTMPPEDVAEFERVCLEPSAAADMHLAEVTSCHHILTMVLGEPAEIDPQVRRRMYELPLKVEAGEKLRIETAHPPITVSAPTAPTQSAVTQPAASAAPSVSPVQAELPDYLRVAAERRRRTQRWATAAVLLVLGGLTMYVLSGALTQPKVPDDVVEALGEQDTDLADIQIGEPTTGEDTAAQDEHVDGQAADESTAAGEASGRQSTQFDDAAPVVDGQQIQNAPAEEHIDTSAPTADVGAEPTTAEQPSTDDTTEPAANLSPPPLAATDSDDQPPPATDTTASEPAATTPPGNEAVSNIAGTNELSLPDVPLPPQDDVSAAPEEQLEPETMSTIPGDPLGIEEGESADSVADTGEPGADVPPEPVGPKQVGAYMGNNDVLLRYEPDSEQWIRMPPRTTVVAGDTLLALPKFRTHVVLGNVNSYLSGGTQVTVLSADEDTQRLSLEIKYGRMLLNAGLKGSDLSLTIGNKTRDFHLDNSASLAVDVHRIFVPGADYQTQSAPVEVNWYLTNGSVHRTRDDGSRETIKAPAAWKSLNEADEAPETVAEVPGWLDREPMTDLERRARDRFAEELPINESVTLRLEELNSEKAGGGEVRSLSAESSLYVGEFEPFVKSLNDSDQRVAWRSHIAAMRQALARDSNTAARLRQAFINVRGPEDGELLFAMVKGFTPQEIGTTRDELKRGVVIDLVRALEHESLDYRVLAIYNLDEIKGTKDLAGYRPDGEPRRRNVSVTKIREMIENNEFLNLP